MFNLSLLFEKNTSVARLIFPLYVIHLCFNLLNTHYRLKKWILNKLYSVKFRSRMICNVLRSIYIKKAKVEVFGLKDYYKKKV